MHFRSSGNWLHQAPASATVGVVIIGGTRLEQGINTESCGAENAANQFQRDATRTDLDEFTHVQRFLAETNVTKNCVVGYGFLRIEFSLQT